VHLSEHLIHPAATQEVAFKLFAAQKISFTSIKMRAWTPNVESTVNASKQQSFGQEF
jgi:hypothetical protein